MLKHTSMQIVTATSITKKFMLAAGAKIFLIFSSFVVNGGENCGGKFQQGRAHTQINMANSVVAATTTAIISTLLSSWLKFPFVHGGGPSLWQCTEI